MTPDRPHVLIYGAGSVGLLIGGLLDAAGIRVTLLARSPTAAAVNAGGLRIEQANGELLARPPAVTSIAPPADPPSLVVLTTKAYDVEPAVADIARLAAGGATVLSLQNGIGTEERLAQNTAIDRLIAGSLTLSVARLGPAHVRVEPGQGGITLAPVSARVDVALVEALLGGAGIRVARAADYRRMKWSKLLLNMLANATAAILAVSPATVVGDPRLFRIERAVFLEALRVMRAARIRPLALPGFNTPLLARAMRLPAPLARCLVAPHIAGGRGDKPPSLRLDLEHGRQATEVDWLNGAVVRYGAQYGTATPVNAALVRAFQNAAAEPGRRPLPADRLARMVMPEPVS